MKQEYKDKIAGLLKAKEEQENAKKEKERRTTAAVQQAMKEVEQKRRLPAKVLEDSVPAIEKEISGLNALGLIPGFSLAVKTNIPPHGKLPNHPFTPVFEMIYDLLDYSLRVQIIKHNETISTASLEFLGKINKGEIEISYSLPGKYSQERNKSIGSYLPEELTWDVIETRISEFIQAFVETQVAV